MRAATDLLPRFSTPALVVDLDLFEANVAAMATLLEGSGKTVRPHVKTHRTPELALRQLGGAAVGVTCATVGEAEAMAAAGIDDILVANEVVGAWKLERLAALARTARVAVAADAAGPVAALSEAAVAAGVTIDVLIDVDTGLRRCGVASPEEAVALAAEIGRHPALQLAGIMGYEGRVRLAVPGRDGKIAAAYATLAGVRRALEEAGFPVRVVSGAGTSTLREALADPTITELQAGVYAVMEPELLVMDLPFACAMSVRGTVISRHPGRVVLDVGRRVVGLEYGPPVPRGFAARSLAVNDEHTIVEMDGPLPPLGDELDLIPGQVRTTFNLYDRVWASRGGETVACWPVAARGRSW
jgi:D-serine deaminase-like pyridoxal phosphate-dependent protein